MPPRTPKRRRRLLTWRRFVYLVAWTGIVAGLYGLLGVLAWRTLRDHGDRFATVAWGGGTVRYDRMEVTRDGRVEIDNLRVALAGESGEPLFSAGEVRVQLDLADLRRPSVEAIELVRPRVSLRGAVTAEVEPPVIEIADAPATPATLPSWLRVGRVAIRDGEFHMDVAGLPSVSLGYDLEFAGLGEATPEALTTGPLRATLRDVRVRDAVTGVGASLGKAEIALALGADLASGVVESARVEGLDAKLTAALWEFLLGNKTPDEPAADPPRWKIAAADIVGARIEIEGHTVGPVAIPDFKAGLDAELRGLDLAGGTKISPESQTLRLSDALLDASLEGFPADGVPPMLRVPSLELRVVPDDFLRENVLESLTLRDPAVSLDKARLARLTASPRPDAGDAPPASYKIRQLSVEGGRLDAEAGQLLAGLPAASARFRVETLGAPEDATALYAVEVTDLALSENGLAERPFGRGQKVTVRLTPEGIQERNRIESIDLDGLDLVIGDEVLRLADTLLAPGEGETPTVAPAAPPPADTVPWRAGRVGVHGSRLTLVNLVPGLPFVPINLDTVLDDVPLTDQARELEKIQRIELSRLEVTSPYDSLTPVAHLKTIFISFTFPGLLRSEIESVEIVSPEIFVGEPLFWYIDYYRNLGAEDGNAAAAREVAAPSKEGSAAAGPGTIAALEDAFSNATFSGWRIKRFQAHSGKIIVAPKGQPLGIFPFPFSFETDLEKRLLSVQLSVESGDYTFEKLEAELLGLKGESYFNYPIREKDNNFVQTFTALGLRFKEYEAQQISLTITYDRAGIYGRLWSAAYGGDLNAEFNIYIGDTYTWDAWASAADFDLGPFTDAVAPDTFRMKGVLGGKFVANGEEFTIHRAYGDATLGPGTMHIRKLDDFIDSLPDGWNGFQKALATAGIDVFRNYDFAEGRAALDMTGRDGTASLFLGGPDGDRDLAFRFIDERAVPGPGKKESPPAAAAP